MVTIAEQLYHYAMGRKGHGHQKKNGKKGYRLKENKNVTKVQDFISDWSIRNNVKVSPNKNKEARK